MKIILNLIKVESTLYNIMKDSTIIINEILESVERLIKNIKTLLTDIKKLFKKKKNITI